MNLLGAILSGFGGALMGAIVALISQQNRKQARREDREDEMWKAIHDLEKQVVGINAVMHYVLDYYTKLDPPKTS